MQFCTYTDTDTHTVSWKPGAKENATLCAVTGRPCSVWSSLHETLHQWEYSFSHTQQYSGGDKVCLFYRTNKEGL